MEVNSKKVRTGQEVRKEGQKEEKMDKRRKGRKEEKDRKEGMKKKTGKKKQTEWMEGRKEERKITGRQDGAQQEGSKEEME